MINTSIYNFPFSKVTVRVCSLLIILMANGCTDLFEYSLYDTPVKSHNMNFTNQKLIQDKYIETDTLKFVLISDTHTFYDDLNDAVKSINKIKSLHFVICSGDVTDTGLNQEFKWYKDIIQKMNVPVITAIGNHDYRSNGHHSFTQYFGNPNDTFSLGKYKFVLFDDVVWENNNKSPKFEWLHAILSNSNGNTILITHIPPWTDQLEGVYNLLFKQIVTPGNAMLCLHGHEHSYMETRYNGILTVVSGSIGKRSYNVISLVGSQVFIQRVDF